ncbi:hypothetical protein F7887_17030 [Bacteroides fragilis]|nr:hypothetical protein EE52_013810 [Bacteroides fragilis]QRM71561.1 hypothetical protein F7887_17030 [Bacteroides fragilis]RGN59912.1 hypothetical protein DXB60_14165 [Bacteroides fragilis]RHH72418.1 hypothetical protein DW198_01325 [Bacteroides fragilis]
MFFCLKNKIICLFRMHRGIFLFVVVVELKLLFHNYLNVIHLSIFLICIYSFTISIDLGTKSMKEFSPQSV